jgi:thiamine biosynthesis lipoprotein
LSDGAFDITSGVLRRVWQFDGSDNVPAAEEVAKLLPLVGWPKVVWRRPIITLQSDMEIDLGGMGKEYAVDRVVDLLKSAFDFPCLVNFGGDLAVTGPAHGNKAWRVGIDARHAAAAGRSIELWEGALATSGDARRFLKKDGKRYGHVIDPRSGWPVIDAAASITVAAASCTQAGMLSTLAMLKGRDAESFLAAQAEKYWCYR